MPGAEPTPGEAHDDSPSPPAGPTIVIADDSPGMLELLSHIVRAASATVVTARDGDAAWSAIRQHRPQVAILDADMPRLTGFDVATLVRADPALAHTRVLLITGHHDAHAHATAAGAHRFLPKPFHPRQLLDAVRDLAA